MDPANQDSLSLQQQYGDRYNEIVRPDRKYAVSHYLRTRWAPLLGAARFWFVVALRQRCYWNDKQDWCVVDKKTIARESGLSLRTVNRIIAAADHPGAEDDRDTLAAWFFDKTRRRRYRQQIGRTVNAPNRYHVLLDDPLTPADQQALSNYIKRHQSDRSPEGTLALLQAMCAHSDAELYEILFPDEPPAQPTSSIPAAYVLDVIEDQCPLPDPESTLYVEIARLASRLHNLLTRPERVYVGNQYFRLNWVPALGPVLSSLVVNLRARCYWNERTGELRDTCRASWADLAREIGCTSRQLRNLRAHPDLALFITDLEEGKAFRVQIPDPLTEADQARFVEQFAGEEQMLRRDPETGQIDFAAILASRSAGSAAEGPQKPEEMAPRKDKDPEILASGGRKFWHIEGINAEILAREPGNSGTTEKIHIITPTPKGLVETALSLTSSQQQDEQQLAAAARIHLLTCLGIQPPGLSKVLAQGPCCETIVAWGLYALTQPGLTENRAGYVYRRLLDGDPAPPDMLALAGLTASAWRSLDHAHRTGTAYMLPQDLLPAHKLWDTHLSFVWATLDVRLGAEREVAVPVMTSLPEELLAQLTERDEFYPTSEGWQIVTGDLYRAYQLLTAEWPGWEEVPVEVCFSDGRWLYTLPAAWLALRITPFGEDQWRAVQEELQMVMPQHVFAEHWQGVVSPLGMCAPDRVLLGVPSEAERAWLFSWQQLNIERVFRGVLGPGMQVEFWVYGVDEGEREGIHT